MNKIQQWDLRVCRVCLLHPYNQPQARISRLVSRTGDGPLYAVAACLLWWQGSAGQEAVRVALWAPLLFVWAALVGASRLLLGVHYLSDLVAGALLGGGCALWALGWSQG